MYHVLSLIKNVSTASQVWCQAPSTLQRIAKRNMKLTTLWTPNGKAIGWSTSSTGKDGWTQIAHRNPSLTWAMWPMPSMISIPPIHPHLAISAASPLLTFCNSSDMSGLLLLSLCSCHLIAWKPIFRRGVVLHIVFFILFIFLPLFFSLTFMVYVALCKPGWAISAADT